MHTFVVDKINGGNVQVLIEGRCCCRCCECWAVVVRRVCAWRYSSLVPRALLQICGFDPLDKNFYMSFYEASSLKKDKSNPMMRNGVLYDGAIDSARKCRVQINAKGPD